MGTDIAVPPQERGGAELIEKVIIRGDLASLAVAERVKYYFRVCESAGLNPLTRPFEFLMLDGRMVLYARKDAADQLRKAHRVSVEILEQSFDWPNGVLTVRSRATMPDGRYDEALGVVSVVVPEKDSKGNTRKDAGEPLKGNNLANAIMKAQTKAARRVTLALCGLGYLDETEIDTIPGAAAVEAEVVRGTEVEERSRQELIRRVLDEADRVGADTKAIVKHFGVTAISFMTAEQAEKALELMAANPASKGGN